MEYLLKHSWLNVLSYRGESPATLVVAYPTGNCQIMCFAYICNLLDRGKEETKKYIKEAVQAVDLPMMLIDVKARFIPVVEDLFSTEDIVFKQPYRNTNSSNMVMYLLLTKNIKNW